MAASPKSKLHRIHKNGYAVNSGVYSAIVPSIKMEMDECGEYKPVYTKPLTKDDYSHLLKVDMMSDDTPSESDISKGLFGEVEGINHDQVLGYYLSLYAGHVIEGDYRKNGSSGGLTSWILSELKRRKLVDGIIHMHAVDPKSNEGKLFKYTVSNSIKDINRGAKSRYYPGELSDALRQIKQHPKRKYAVVGIPEFITELRLLADIDPQVKRQIPFMVGLVCGHQKSAKYVEALAWQHGIKPGDLQEVDFRVKQPNSTAVDYLHRFSGLKDGKNVEFTKSHDELFGEVWAYGFFKTKFSDFTDNVFNETADIVLGDAWLPEYRKDGMGNNIAIIRNPIIRDIFKEAIEDNRLNLDTVSADTVKKSQLGLIHHAQDEIGYRVRKQWPRWTPRKRYNDPNLPALRRRVQDLRYRMARKSHRIYQEALSRQDWMYFESTMAKDVEEYKKLYEILKSSNRGEVMQKSLMDKIRIRLKVRTRLRKVKRKIRIRTRLRELRSSLYERREMSLRRRILSAPDGAILTLTGYFNYGNMLQRYALQRFLLTNGYYFVSYAQEPFNTRGKEFDRLRYTIPFVQNRIARKSPHKNDSYGAYITGSDQVWRKWGPMEGSDPLSSVRYYMFDFVRSDTAKRVAYAASFGHADIKSARLTDEFMGSVKPLIDKMSAISMRESSGVDIVKEWWGVDSTVTVDPTMLLASTDYDRLIRNSTVALRESPAIFAYILDNGVQGKSGVSRIIDAYSEPHEILYLKEADTLPPVEQWLKNIRDAELVVTDSFHGVVFSVLYNTPFVVTENTGGGLSRLENILSKLGLEHRMVRKTDIEDFSTSTMGDIDWSSVNSKLDSLRRESGAWLLGALRN